MKDETAMTTRRLQGRAALITGAASGIGKATARLFLEEGASVGIADNNASLARATADELRTIGPVHVVVGDVASAADGARMVEETSAAFGKLDVVVCAAGIPSRSRIADLTEAEFDRIIGVNLKGMYTVIHAAIPHLKRQGGGTIVTIGSEMGFVADSNAPAYNASKGGVIMFTKSIAIDLIRDNIRVNSLCPGITQTPLLDTEIATSPDPEATRIEFAEWAPIGRAADPAEQARGVLFLACDESSFAVGTTLLLDGGYTAI
jgi:NAD(P)-dependent dehydrogenase (short-subunit alcohol dehydrogenase family)